jgi:hypothetical protein
MNDTTNQADNVKHDAIVSVLRKAYESTRAEQCGAHSFKWTVKNHLPGANGPLNDDHGTPLRCVTVDYTKADGTLGNNLRLDVGEIACMLAIVHFARFELHNNVGREAPIGDLPRGVVAKYAAKDLKDLADALGVHERGDMVGSVGGARVAAVTLDRDALAADYLRNYVSPDGDGVAIAKAAYEFADTMIRQAAVVPDDVKALVELSNNGTRAALASAESSTDLLILHVDGDVVLDRVTVTMSITATGARLSVHGAWIGAPAVMRHGSSATIRVQSCSFGDSFTLKGRLHSNIVNSGCLFSIEAVDELSDDGLFARLLLSGKQDVATP